MLQAIQELTKTLNQACHEYYVLDNPTLPDSEFDRLFRELQALEAKYPQFKQPDSPTQRVGMSSANKFNKVKHAVAMLSLENVFSNEELTDWLKSNVGVTLPKSGT